MTARKVTAIADTNIRSLRGVKKAKSRARSEEPSRRTRRLWSDVSEPAMAVQAEAQPSRLGYRFVFYFSSSVCSSLVFFPPSQV